jgi:hypothetical protein
VRFGSGGRDMKKMRILVSSPVYNGSFCLPEPSDVGLVVSITNEGEYRLLINKLVGNDSGSSYPLEPGHTVEFCRALDGWL